MTVDISSGGPISSNLGVSVFAATAVEILEDNVAELVESFQAISLDNIVVTMSGNPVVLTVDESDRIIWSDAARIMIDDNDCKCCFKMCSDGCGFAS